MALARHCSGGRASARRSTGCCAACGRGRAACWSCAERRASARPRCSSASSSRRPAGASSARRACRPRWSSRSPGCISSAARSSTGSTSFPARSATRCARRSGSRPAARRTTSGWRSRSWACWPTRRRSARSSCLVDDAQWLDRASRQALAFVARRLLAERIAMVFAVREPSDTDELDGLPELRVEGLSDDDARTMLAAGITGTMDSRVRDRILAETRGNPLALQELPRGLTPAELGGRLRAARPRPAGGADREELPAALRGAAPRLAAAAAHRGGRADRRRPPPLARGRAARDRRRRGRAGRGRRAVRARCARAVPSPAGALGDLPGGTARGAPRGPPRAGRGDRSRSGSRSARVASRARGRGARRGGGRRAGALGRSRAGSRRRRRRRGVPRARGRADPRSARSEARGRSRPRGRCSTRARPEAAEALLATAELAPLDELQRARLERLRAQIAFARTRGRDAPALLHHAARRLDPLDAAMARETHLEALAAAMFAGRLGGEPGLREVAEAARAAPAAPQPPRAIDLLLDGLATRFTEGYTASVPPLRARARRVRRRGGAEGARRALALARVPRGAGPLGRRAVARALGHAGCALAREAGALSVLPIAATYRAALHVHAGAFGDAAPLIEETDAILARDRHVAGQVRADVARPRGAATRPQARALFDASRPQATARGEGMGLGVLDWATALLYNGNGRYAEALAAAQRGLRVRRRRALRLVARRADRGGRPHRRDARRPPPRSSASASARRRPAPTGRSASRPSRARWSPTGRPRSPSTARRSSGSARSRGVVHVARAQLLYGEWLRREQRRVDAREQLRAAHETFGRIGADAFAERARRELTATGETVRRLTVETRDVLTPQETQVAQLAQEGRTNPEIGAELFISPRTVEYHLHKVFTKLGISSRKELRGALGRGADTGLGNRLGGPTEEAGGPGRDRDRRSAPTERERHAPDHRPRPRRLRRVLELGSGHRPPPRRGSVAWSPSRTRCAASPPTPPPSATTSAPSRARSCWSRTPTAAPSSPTSTATPATSSGSSTSTASPRTPASTASSSRRCSPAAWSASPRCGRSRAATARPTSRSPRQLPRGLLPGPPRAGRPRGWRSPSAPPPRRRSPSRRATARCGRTCRRGS